MSIGKLTGLISQNVINQFKVSSGSGAIRTSGFGASANTEIKGALQVGQRAYTASVEHLGSALSALNLSEDSLEKLGTIVEDMIVLVEKATQDNVSDGTRSRLDNQFRDLVSDFHDIVEDAEINGLSVLSKEGISSLLQEVGLDVEASEVLATAFEAAVTTPKDDDSLSTEKIRGKRPVRLPQETRQATIPGGIGLGTDEDTTLVGTNVEGVVPLSGSSNFSDYNGDGVQDIVTVSDESDRTHLQVSLGNSDGTFAAVQRQDVGTSGSTADSAAADFDGDGEADLVFAKTGGTDAGLSIAISNGDGTFGAAQTLAIGGGVAGVEATSVITGDFDGDTFQDILVKNSTDGTIEAFLGNGDGTFAAGISTAFAGDVSEIKVGYFDGDADLDFAAIDNSGPGAVLSYALGNGDGTFGAQVTIALDGSGVAQEGLALGDFNGDSNVDIVVTRGSDAQGTAILVGNGNGTFAAATSIAVTNNAGAVELSDLDGDGNDDLLISESAGFEIRYSNGDGTFQAAISLAASGVSAVFAADIDGDSSVDLVGVDTENGGIRTALGAVSGGTAYGTQVSSAEESNDFQSGFIANEFNVFQQESVMGDHTYTAVDRHNDGVDINHFINVGDLNNDGYDDVVSSSLGGKTSFVRFANSDGTFAASVSFLSYADRHTLIGDFDGDGNVDLMGIGFNDRGFLAGNGDGTFAAAVSWLVTSTQHGIAADVDGDGDLDLVNLFSNQDAALVELNNGDATFTAAVSFRVGDNPFHVSSGDLNNDGYLDLVTTNILSDDHSVLLGNGNGTFQAAITLDASITNNVYSTTLVDVDGDSILDIVASNDSGTANINIFIGNGDGTFQASQSIDVGSTNRGIIAGDFDGDGISDIAVQTTAAAISILHGNDDGSFSAYTSVASDFNAHDIIAADFDNNGVFDFAVANYNDDDVAIILGNGAPTETITVQSVSGGSTLLDIGLAGELLAVNEQSGYSVISSDQDFLGFNTNNYNNLFLVDYTGAVVAQITDNQASATLAYTGADLSSDNLSVAYSEVDGVSKAVRLAVLDEFNQDPSTASTVATFDTISGGGDFSQVTISNDGNYVAFKKDTGTVSVGLYDSATQTGDAFLAADSSVSDFGFVDTGTLAVALEGGATDSIREYTYNDGAYGATIATSYNVGTLVTYEKGENFSYAVGIQDASTNNLYLLDQNGSVLQTTSAPAAVSQMNIARSQSGDFELGVVGDFTDPGSTSEQLFRLESSTVKDGGNLAGASETLLFTSGATEALFTGDLNNDGNIDLLSGSFAGSSSAFIALGNGDGTFAAESAFGIGGFASVIDLKDLNGDGNLDILVDNSNEMILYAGNGDGTFAISATVSTASTNYSYTSADIDNDGDIDLLAQRDGVGTSTAELFLNNGDGTFAAAYSFGDASAQDEFGSAYFVDTNSDGMLDLVRTSRSSNAEVMLGNGDGTFQAHTANTGVTDNQELQFYDFNGDGNIDIFEPTTSLYSSKIRFGNGDGTFGSVATASIYGWSGFHLADINDDGNVDIVRGPLDEVSVILGNGDGTFNAALTFNGGAGEIAHFASADLNGDGIKELLYKNVDEEVHVLDLGTKVNTNTVAFEESYYLNAAATHGGFSNSSAFTTAGDFNNDGTTDMVVVSDQADAINIQVSIGNSNGTFALVVSQNLGFGSASSVTNTDFDGDGNADLVIGVEDSGARGVYVAFSNGDGTFAAPVSYALADSSGNEDVSAVVVGDFDNDGSQDFAARNEGDDTVEIFTGNGDGTFAAGVTSVLAGTVSTMIVTDLNGDNNDDLVAIDPTDSTAVLSYMLGNGDGTFEAQVTRSLGGTAQTGLSAGDVTGDGNIDIVVTQGTGDIAIISGNADGTLGAVSNLAATNTAGKVSLQDLDQDGELDLLIQENHSLEVRYGNGDGTFAAPESYSAVNTTTFEAFDLNADGHLDLFGLAPVEGIIRSFISGEGEGSAGSGTQTIDFDFQLLGGNQLFEKIFDSDRRLTSRADAFFLLEDLKALQEQIEANKDVVGELKLIVDGNITVARAAAESFLSRQNSIGDSEEATSIARKISQDIVREAGKAVQFVHDLEIVGVVNLLKSDDE